MVEIYFPGGVAREMEEKDILVLSAISQEEDIIKFYFSEKINPNEEYWKRKLENQQQHRSMADYWIRPMYDLPIIENGNVQGLININIDPYVIKTEKHFAGLSYFVGKDFRRRGLAQRVLKAAIPRIFDELNAGAIHADCFEKNIASQNLLLKVGLQKRWEGHPENIRENRKLIVYGITSSEYLERVG